jgi:hypothetical protein
MKRSIVVVSILLCGFVAFGQAGDKDRPPNRNVMAIGYQLGGFSLVGFEYEYRIGDVLGLQMGAGWAGATAGIKLHVNPSKDSLFLNLSWKDGGFGLLEVVAFETGGRLPFKPGGFGLHAQAGFMYILSIDPEFEDDMFGDDGVPPIGLSIGVGFSF